MELNEKAVSKKQQRFFGMVRAAQKGEGASSPEVAKVADEISDKDAKKFAKTKHKGLPEKKEVKEGSSMIYVGKKGQYHGPTGDHRRDKEGNIVASHYKKKPSPTGEKYGDKSNRPKTPKPADVRKRTKKGETTRSALNRAKKYEREKVRVYQGDAKRKAAKTGEYAKGFNEAVKGQDTLSRKEGAKERATEKKAHDTWKKSGVGKTKRPLYSTTRHTKGDAESYATQQKQSIKWHHKRTKGKYFPGEQPIGEELTGDMKTDLEKYRVPRGPGGNPIRIGDKVRSMNSNQPLGKLKVKYGADKVREYYKKNKAVGESAVLDANKKLENQAWRKKKQKEYAKLIAIYNHQKQLEKQGLGSSTKRKKTSESFEIDKSAHKKVQRQAKIRNLAKDNKNPNEKAAAERKLKGPKLAWEEFKKHI